MSRVSNGEDKLKVQGVATCHNLIGRKSKVMDKRIRKSKGANRRVTHGKMRPPKVTLDQTNSVGRRRRKRGKKKEKIEKRER